MKLKAVVASLVLVTCPGLAADRAAAAPVASSTQSRSPLTVLSPGVVFIPAAPSFFSEKQVQAGNIGQDTYIGGVFVPAGAYVRQAEYASVCSAPDCITLQTLTPQNGMIQVGLGPVFAEHIYSPGGAIPVTSTRGSIILSVLIVLAGWMGFRRVRATSSGASPATSLPSIRRWKSVICA